MINIVFKNTIRFVLFILIQVLILNNIQLSGLLNPYLYVICILLLPFETPKWLLLILGFVLGLIIDIFSNTPGLHASATVFLAFMRPFVLRMISPRDGYEAGTGPFISKMGLIWFIKYIVILVLFHHFFLFFVEVFRFSDFFITILRIMISSAFTIILIMVSQLFVLKRDK